MEQDTLAQIALQFSTQNDLGGELIRAFSHGLYSHVDAIMPDGRLLGARSDVIGDVSAGVQIRPAGYAPFSAVKRVVLYTATDIEAAFWDFLQSQIGKGYDETAILAFAIDRDWREADKWFCSELVMAALEKSGYFANPLSAPANKITPADALFVLSAMTLV